MVLDTMQVRFLFVSRGIVSSVSLAKSHSTHLTVLQTEIRDTSHRRSSSLGQVLVHRVNLVRDVGVGGVEEIASLLLEEGEGVLCTLGCLASFVKLGVDRFESCLRVTESE